ncbi:PREDICTED: zinc finger CCCH domain-containing protein 40-like [Populus euphratica]|uniref:Zinc finger CCCH domain-containing protein 40-like n=1 Tax=Populus euphratica TaxID=75702 RepID=A0AAJ6UMN6_POPEU|nr:PREDICTED: zinc finger CCCH domain-containing protein 40-like [Populus euphratica]
MAHRLLKDPEADGWERSDFPIICESCLGDNPYVRMTRADFDKECKICTRPFTVFRWRPGRDARFKKTEVCQTCSKLKNVCQVCLLDLEYGLPVQVRDTALSINSNDAIPKSDVNREYFAEEHDRRARAGIDYESSYGKAQANDTILKLQRTTPYYKRNRAHVCSFFARGECTRGAECPYRHEMPITGELSQQNIKDRYYGNILPWHSQNMGPVADDIRLSLADDFAMLLTIELKPPPLLNKCSFLTCLYSSPLKLISEKAAAELSNRLVIKGLRLKLMWGRPQAPKPEMESSDEARQQAAMAHSGMLPRAVVSQQHSHLNPPGTQGQHPPMHYFNIPPPPQQERAFYPSMDPQRMGALVGSQDGTPNGPAGSGENKSGLEKQLGQHYPYQSMPPPHVQYQQQHYPPYGYMPPVPPYQQYPLPYHTPVPLPQGVQSTQKHQHQHQHLVLQPMAAPAESMTSLPPPQGSQAPAGPMPSEPSSQGSEAPAGSKTSSPPSPRPGESEKSKPSGPLP